MSTRSNIKVIDDYTDESDDSPWKQPIWFYRHSDGYPEGALPLIKTFCEWVSQGRIRDNASQASGWLILLGAKEYDEEWVSTPTGLNRAKKATLFEPANNDFSGWKCGAIEPTHGEHGDIEFLYTIDLGNQLLTISQVYGGKSMTVGFDEIDIDHIAKTVGYSSDEE